MPWLIYHKRFMPKKATTMIIYSQAKSAGAHWETLAAPLRI